MMLQLLPMVAREQIAPLIKDDGKFETNVYHEFAGFPMTWSPQGSMRGETPFDVNEFLRRVVSGEGQSSLVPELVLNPLNRTERD